jgi:hypothetical protein
MTDRSTNREPYLIWLSILTGAVVMAVIGFVIGLAALGSDLTHLNDQVAALKFGVPASSSDMTPVSTPVGDRTQRNINFSAQIDGLSLLKDSLVVSLTVQFGGPANLLYQPPIVRGEAGRIYPITAASLKAARAAFLNLITAGEVSTPLVFQPVPLKAESLTLVFNPTMPAGDAVAPQIEVPLSGGS